MEVSSSPVVGQQLELFEEARAESWYLTVRSTNVVEQLARESGEPPPVPKRVNLKLTGKLISQMGLPDMIKYPEARPVELVYNGVASFTIDLLGEQSIHTAKGSAVGCRVDYPNLVFADMVYKGCRWSAWVGLPQRLLREPFDEASHPCECSNLMLLAVPVILPDTLPQRESDNDAVVQPNLTREVGRVCSDRIFVPGTHIFLIRIEGAVFTEHTAAHHHPGVPPPRSRLRPLTPAPLVLGESVVCRLVLCDLAADALGIDLKANTLMEEVAIATSKECEGAAWVGGFGPFPKPGPADDEKMIRMERKAKKRTPKVRVAHSPWLLIAIASRSR